MKNKTLLIALLFLGLQPFAAKAMDEQKQKTEEIVEIKEIIENNSNESFVIVEETTKIIEENGNVRPSLMPSLPKMPSIGSLATQAVNTVVITPFHKFVDSHYGGVLPGGFLALDYVYSNTLGNPYNEALARKTARLLCWGLLVYKTYRWNSGLEQIQKVLHAHTQQLDTILKNVAQLKTALETKMTRNHLELTKKLGTLKSAQDNQTIMLQEVSDKTTSIHNKLDGIEKTMATKGQMEQLTQKVSALETTSTENQKGTNELTSMFKIFMQRSAESHSDIKQLRQDNQEIKMYNKEILDNQAKSEKAQEIVLQQQVLSLRQIEEYVSKQKEMMQNLNVVLNMSAIMNKAKQKQ